MRSVILRLLPLACALGAVDAHALTAWRGDQRALVLLVQWSNVASTVTAADVDATFFDETTQSMRAFFQENAQGAFDLTGDVMDWRRSTRAFNATAGCDLDPIVAEAWRLFGADVDVSSYDADGDGKIDNLFVVHSGRIGSDRVGPECTFTSSSRANYTAVFQSQGIGSIGTAIPFGFYIHEGGHGYYNFPDLYADHYHGRYGIGMWGMMGLGCWGVRNDIEQSELFRYPGHFEPLSKIRIGWTSPRVVNRTTRQVTIEPVEATNDIVAVPVSSGTNYYLEYRSDRGFSAGHHGHGLLLWKNYTLVQADGRDDLNHGNSLGRRPLPPIAENFGDATDPFPGANGVTSYEDRSAGIRFENITQTDDAITLDIVITTEGLPYTEPVIAEFRAPWEL
jgi:M6 family metalloprotease-like protein